MVHEKAGGEDVTAGGVRLDFGEIAETQDVVVVGVDGQFGVDDVVVLTVEGVVEPRLSLLNRTGEGDPREKLVEAPSMLVLHGGNKVGGGKAEVVVADAGVEFEKATRTFAGFGGFARGLDLNGAESVGA